MQSGALISTSANLPAHSLRTLPNFLMSFGWDAATTLIVGLAAVGAAVWTIRDTRRSTWVNIFETRRAVAKRTKAVMAQMAENIERETSMTPPEMIIAKNALAALAADVGVLGAGDIEKFVTIDSAMTRLDYLKQARLLQTSGSEEDVAIAREMDEVLKNIETPCIELRDSSAQLVSKIEEWLTDYYEHPFRSLLKRPPPI